MRLYQRERERQTDRQTETETQRHRERQRETQTQTDRQTEAETERWSGGGSKYYSPSVKMYDNSNGERENLITLTKRDTVQVHP